MPAKPRGSAKPRRVRDGQNWQDQGQRAAQAAQARPQHQQDEQAQGGLQVDVEVIDLVAEAESGPAVDVDIRVSDQQTKPMRAQAATAQHPATHVPSAAPLTLSGSSQPAPQPADTRSEVHQALGYLVQRCVGANRGPAMASMALRPALQTQAEQLSAALNSVITDVTSVSVLVMGDPGAGKTLVVERAIATVCGQHNLGGERVMGVVRLSGALHTDERAAFQDIARQLCREFGQEFSAAASYDENLAFLRTMLATLYTHCKAAVFVLDGFERFARARGKQQLLYNLLDVLQHCRVQAAVIGVTCAQDVMELMEKRVRSRFSHRRMLVTGLPYFEVPTAAPPAPAAAVAATGPARTPAGAAAEVPPADPGNTPCGVLLSILSLPAPATASGAGTAAPGPLAQPCPADSPMAVSSAFVAAHNAQAAAAIQDPAVKEALRRLFQLGLKPRDLMGIARWALDAWEASWPAGNGGTPGGWPPLQACHLLAGIDAHQPQPQAVQLLDLSVLQLYLVAGMARLEGKSQQAYNFEMVWDECRSFHDSRGVLSAFTHGAGWRAFEELVGQGIAHWVNVTAEATGRDMRYAGASLAVPPAEVGQALRAHDSCPSELLKFFHVEA